MNKEQLIKEIMRIKPNLYSLCKLEAMSEEWLLSKFHELRGRK